MTGEVGLSDVMALCESVNDQKTDEGWLLTTHKCSKSKSKAWTTHPAAMSNWSIFCLACSSGFISEFLRAYLNL